MVCAAVGLFISNVPFTPLMVPAVRVMIPFTCNVPAFKVSNGVLAGTGALKVILRTACVVAMVGMKV